LTMRPPTLCIRRFGSHDAYFKEDFGNALSVYDLGTRARDAIEKARLEVASL